MSSRTTLLDPARRRSNILPQGPQSKRKTTKSEKALFDDKMHRHRHNASLGCMTRAETYLSGIYKPGLTDDALVLYQNAERALNALHENIYRYRKELDGSVREIEHAVEAVKPVF